jgi:Domain of unknown function (DUF4395)
MVDSHLPRFAQGVQALALAIAFLLLQEWVVLVLGALLIAASTGGARFNLFAYLYRALPIPRGEPEAAAPPRFAQAIGAIFLSVSSVMLFVAEERSVAWWTGGWGPALAVALLAGIAATTKF